MEKMFCTYVWQKAMTQELLEPLFVSHDNEHVLDCCPKVCAKFALVWNLVWICFSDKTINNILKENEQIEGSISVI